MAYFSDLNNYLHQSSLLLQAYPSARITTKYSLPRKPNTKAKSQPKAAKIPVAHNDAIESSTNLAQAQKQLAQKRERSAMLTLKTYHPESGICLKYRTDKAAEVGRLLNGLGRLAKGESIEVPSASSAAAGANVNDADAEKMDIDGGDAVPATVKLEEKTVTAPPAVAQGAGGGKGKKKKGKK